MNSEQVKVADRAPVEWLLDGPAFVRYRALLDTMGHSHEETEVRETRDAILREPEVADLLERRNDHGYWGNPRDVFTWWPKTDTTFWVLGVLADFGLTREDCGIARACDYVLGTQLPGGGFGIRPPPKSYECFTGVLTAALARLGYVHDTRLERAYHWLESRQRADGGFWCEDTGQPGCPREREPSCALASLWVLAALGAHPARRRAQCAARCAAFLLDCWDNRSRIKYAGHDSRIGSGWEKLKYPYTDYRILHYLDTISLVPSVSQDVRAREIARMLRSKRDREGRFQPESIHRAWSAFDFGRKEPSRWLTCQAYGILARLNS